MTTTRRNFTVESRAFQWNRWGEWETVGTFYAKDAAEAKKDARAQAKRNGWTRQDGTLEFRARLASE